MKRIAFLGLGLALAACGNADGDLNAAVIGVSRVTASVVYNPETGNYTVTPIDGAPVTYFGNSSGDALGFDFAADGGSAFLLSRASEGTSATLLVEDIEDASSAAVLLVRPDDSNMPTEGDAEYVGVYMAAFFANDLYTGAVTGTSTINVDFDTRDIGGTITGREYVGFVGDTTTIVVFDVPDVALEDGRLTLNGQVRNVGLTADAPASTASFTVPGGETFTNTSGTYGGLISGVDGAFFVGGVELIYEGDGDPATTGREVGAIFTDIVAPPP